MATACCYAGNKLCKNFAAAPPNGYKIVYPLCWEHLAVQDSLKYKDEIVALVKEHPEVHCPICFTTLSDSEEVLGELFKLYCCKQFICRECLNDTLVDTCVLCKKFHDIDLWDFKLCKITEFHTSIIDFSDFLNIKTKYLDKIHKLQTVLPLIEEFDEISTPVEKSLFETLQELFSPISITFTPVSFVKI